LNKKTTAPLVRWELDEWCAKTFRSMCHFDADVFVKFFPDASTAEQPRRIEYIATVEKTDKDNPDDTEFEKYQRDRIVMTIPVKGLEQEILVELDPLDDFDTYAPGTTMLVHSAKLSLWVTKDN
jgi:hypothetical protein